MIVGIGVNSMLKIFKKKKEKTKIYDFKYEILWNNGTTTFGEITNSELEPYDIFLTNKMTYFGNMASYFNKDEIKQIEIKDLVEKVEE